MKEVVKYFSKIFFFPDPNKRKKDQDRFVYLKSLDNIFEAFSGVQIFKGFGIDLPAETSTAKQTKDLQTFDQLMVDPKLVDWLKTSGDEVLTGYEAPISKILKSNVDVQNRVISDLS